MKLDKDGGEKGRRKKEKILHIANFTAATEWKIYIYIYKMIKNTSGRKLLWYHVERQLSYFSTVFHWGTGGEGVVGGLRDRVDLHSLKLINIAFARGYQKVAFILHLLHT